MFDTRTIQESVSAFRQTAVGYGFQLRHHLAALIVDNLERLDWNQDLLAKASGKKPSYISRLIHSDANFQADVAGAILHALDTRAREMGQRVESAIYNPSKYTLQPKTWAASAPMRLRTTGDAYGQAIAFKQDIGQIVRFHSASTG